MTDFPPYFAEIKPGPNGYIKIREPYGWHEVEAHEHPALPDGYEIVHSTDAEVRWWENIWGTGLIFFGLVFGFMVLAAIWNVGRQMP